MNFYEKLKHAAQLNRSLVCVGLDPDLKKLPACLAGKKNPIFEFNKAIIDATRDWVCCYKPQVAYYAGQGADAELAMTIDYIREQAPLMPVILDAKRGDIGNTSAMYARAFFENGSADAVTLSPYMGRDTVEPFLAYEGKWAVILALNSNASAADFEILPLANGRKLYEQVLETASEWGSRNNTMFVVGATQAMMLGGIRKIVPDHFLLVPGVGAQGGSLQDVAAYGMNSHCGLLVNSSRGIIYASQGEDFASAAALKAQAMQQEMDKLLKMYL